MVMTESDKHAVEAAVAAFRDGQFVIIVDDDDRENEGDLAIAAEHITPEAVNFMVTEGRGLVCVAMQSDLLDRLQIPMMVPDGRNSSGFGTGFTVSVEASEGVSTGISAQDRAHTISTLINPVTTPSDIAMPGHIFPLRAKSGGVLERRGQTEASVDLASLAGLTPAGVICELMSHDGTMARRPELETFSQQHNIPIVSVEALANYRQSMSHSPRQQNTAAGNSADITLIGNSLMPTKHGEFRVAIFRDAQGLEHSALISGETTAGDALVRIHSECLTGDAFGSLRCDCGEQLEAALRQIADSPGGILLYLKQEGRGIGLGNKIRAYELQDQGMDTVQANEHLGFPADARHYDVAASMLEQLGAKQIRLLTNNPAKREALQSLGITVTAQIPLIIEPQRHNQHYLETKAARMGHDLPALKPTAINNDDDQATCVN